MGRTDASGRHQRRQRRLLIFLCGFLVLGSVTTNSLSTSVAQAISLPLTQVVDTLTPSISSPASPSILTTLATPQQTGQADTTSPASVLALDTTPPSVPTEPFSPADHSHSSQQVDYSWGASTDDGGQPVGYEFRYARELDEEGDLRNPVYPLGLLDEPTYHPRDPQNDGIIYWQVRARDASGNHSQWSQLHDVTIDTVAPAVSHMLTADQPLSGVETLSEVVDELNIAEVSIQIFNPDDTHVIVDDNPVGVVQNPANGNTLDFDWDTRNVADGTYRVVFGARDRAGNSQTVSVPVIVANGENPDTGPFFPPITPDLAPIALSETVVLTVAQEELTRTSEPADDTPDSEVLGEQNDTLAQRIETAAAAAQESQRDPASHCALFFGICWYWSVPGTVLVAVIGYLLYYFRQRIA